MQWLDELIDEYSEQVENRAQRQHNTKFVDRLERAYADEPPAVMMSAVLGYVKENKFFPKTADLHPYVLAAQENARGPVAYNDLTTQFNYGRFGHGPYGDDDILAWEQQRGTMPADAGEWLPDPLPVLLVPA